MCQLKRIVVEKVKAEREREKEVRRAVYLLTSSSSSVNSQDNLNIFKQASAESQNVERPNSLYSLNQALHPPCWTALYFDFNAKQITYKR